MMWKLDEMLLDVSVKLIYTDSAYKLNPFLNMGISHDLIIFKKNIFYITF